MARHLDLVRSDWNKEADVLQARIVLGDADDPGIIIHPEVIDQNVEGLVWEAIGGGVGPGDTAERIVEKLHRHFRNVYLFVVGPHGDEECPFRSGPVAMKWENVEGSFRMPRPGGSIKTSGAGN